MSATAALLIFVLVWLAIGVVASLVMGRRGHEPFIWGTLGAALGPLVIPLASGSVQRERDAARSVLGEGSAGPGAVNVLVGVDGSAESRAALYRVVDLLGPQIGRLTLAAVLDFDSAEELDGSDAQRAAIEQLDAATREAERAWTRGTVGRMLLVGSPATALVAHARESGDDLIAIGCRGQGASRIAFGSVATRLARSTEVPVFIVGGSVS
jgi:nucleotide-binding universal stress UspA family protein